MRVVIIALLILLASLLPAAAGGSLEVPIRQSEEPGAPVTERLKLYSASKALVIGIDKYGAAGGWFGTGTFKGWPKLSMGIKDAEEVAKALEAKGFKVTLLKDLGSEALKRAMDDFFIREGTDSQSRMLVWFAGHGHTIDGEGYLVPADAPLPATDEVEFRSKALSLRQFGYYMREARAKHVLAVFDSCFSGTIFEVARAAPPRAITRATALKVRQYISSGDADQLVSDNGRFRRLFLDALDGKEPAADPNGDGFITGSELGNFLSDKITNLSERGQTPRYGRLIAEGFDRGDFVLEKGAIDLPVPPPPPAPSSAAETVRICREVEQMSSLSMLEVLERQHKGTPAADCISARMGELKAAQTAAAKEAEAEHQRIAMLQQQEADRKRADEAKQLAPGRVFRDCPDCPEMVVVPAGSFTMGSPESEAGRYKNEGPRRTVTIGRPFGVGKFEVTLAEWDACVAGGGCKHKPDDEYWGRGKRPAINVSRNDAKEYVSWLSKKTGQTYRLLTEAEWEYAARAGTTTPFSTGVTITTDQANFDGNSTYGGSAKGIDRIETVEVGSFKANAYGLYDMHGNVWERVEDCYHANYNGAPSDGSAWTTGDCKKTDDGKDVERVVRGGSWSDFPELLRSASRVRDQPDGRDVIVGFRLARTLNPTP